MNDMKKKMLCLILVLFMPVLMLCGCGCSKEPYFEGEICHLEYKERYTTTIIIPITIYNGKTTSIVRDNPDDKDNYIDARIFIYSKSLNEEPLEKWNNKILGLKEQSDKEHNN